MKTMDAYTEASQWLLRLKNEHVSQADVSAWLDWCNEKPQNLESFERAQDLYDRLQQVDEGARGRFLELDEGNGRRALWPMALAASLLASLGLAAWRPWTPGLANEHREYRVAHGDQRELVLADHSKVTLGSASAVASAFEASRRDIDLRDGEAYFDVRPDRTRPFVVRAGHVSVTAIGTAFSVRRTGERTVVTVTEGLVDVLPLETSTAGSSTTAPVRVRAGQQAVYDAGSRGVMVAAIDPGAATAWLKGRREYMVEPLGSVIDDINRYSREPVVLTDPHLRELVFTGTVFDHQVDEWVRALDGVFPVRVVSMLDGRILIESREKNFR